MLVATSVSADDATITGEARVWHPVTVTIDGPSANETDTSPNPFTDYRMTVTFKHSDGKTYSVPGFFAADGDAANSSASSGNKWRCHFAPDRAGDWTYDVDFVTGTDVAIDNSAGGTPVADCDSITGSISVKPTNKKDRDLRAHGRLDYVGTRYLRFAGSGEYFLKAGADAPETLLGYADFDGTVANNPKKVPLKTFAPHVGDWRGKDPTWAGGKGKGLVGMVSYLSAKGCNAFSFLTYNAGGDGDNVWPFIARDEKMHYDCSKLDQWNIVFTHGTNNGMYLHFKLQETENDDDRGRPKADDKVTTSLDGGKLGRERKLYLRELIARFGHQLALNWNLGEENTQSTSEQIAMIDYITKHDAYQHPIVLHTFPNEQDKVYLPLIGNKPGLAGVSLQNSHIRDTHWQVVKWVTKSTAAGKPWVVAFDESGSAAHGQCPDTGYRGYDGHDDDGKMTYTEHEVRRQTLWGTLMGGGAGVEYYFGYKYAENDLRCEDWRSRDRSWDYCRVAIDFFRNENIPVQETMPADNLIGNEGRDNEAYCLAKAGELYLVYLAGGGSIDLDVTGAEGEFTITRMDPRTGEISTEGTQKLAGQESLPIVAPENDDWLVMVRKN